MKKFTKRRQRLRRKHGAGNNATNNHTTNIVVPQRFAMENTTPMYATYGPIRPNINTRRAIVRSNVQTNTVKNYKSPVKRRIATRSASPTNSYVVPLNSPIPSKVDMEQPSEVMPVSTSRWSVLHAQQRPAVRRLIFD